MAVLRSAFAQPYYRAAAKNPGLMANDPRLGIHRYAVLADATGSKAER
jgi:hypothetical protein